MFIFVWCVVFCFSSSTETLTFNYKNNYTGNHTSKTLVDYSENHKFNHTYTFNHPFNHTSYHLSNYTSNHTSKLTKKSPSSVSNISGTAFYDNASIAISDLDRIIYKDNKSNKASAFKTQGNKVGRAAEETLLDCYFTEEVEGNRQSECQALSNAWPENSHRFSLLSIPSRYKKLIRINSTSGSIRLTSSIDRESICEPTEQDCFIVVNIFRVSIYIMPIFIAFKPF